MIEHDFAAKALLVVLFRIGALDVLASRSMTSMKTKMLIHSNIYLLYSYHSI